MSEDGVRVPPSFHDPLPPSKPSRATGAWVVAGIVLALSALLAGWTLLAERDAARDAAAHGERIRRVRAEVARVLERPADSVAVPPRPDGTRRYASPAPTSSTHGFHLTLPRGWNATHAGVDAGAEYVDSVLTKPGRHGRAVVAIVRLETFLDVASPEFADALRAGLVDPEGGDLDIATPWTETTVGDDAAYYFDGYADDGAVRTRSLAFRHGGETFTVDFSCPAELWDETLPDLRRLLASWEWG